MQHVVEKLVELINVSRETLINHLSFLISNFQLSKITKSEIITA